MIDSPDNLDARTLSIVRSSVLARLLVHALSALMAAWRDSSVRRLIPQEFDPRIAGTVMVIASVTAILFQRLATRPGPLTWIVPSLFLVAGLCLIASSRAWIGRER